jgi:hypothetical protein
MVGSVRLLEEKTAAIRARIHIISLKYITPTPEMQTCFRFFLAHPPSPLFLAQSTERPNRSLGRA